MGLLLYSDIDWNEILYESGVTKWIFEYEKKLEKQEDYLIVIAALVNYSLCQTDDTNWELSQNIGCFFLNWYHKIFE